MGQSEIHNDSMKQEKKITSLKIYEKEQRNFKEKAQRKRFKRSKGQITGIFLKEHGA